MEISIVTDIVVLLAIFTPTIKYLKTGMQAVKDFDLKEYKD